MRTETIEQRNHRLERKRQYYQTHKEQWSNYEKTHRKELNVKIRERRKNPLSHNSRLTIERKWKKENPETMKVARKNWINNHPEKIIAYNREQRILYPDKFKLHNHARFLPLNNECEICSSIKDLEKHHPDYSEPEIVITLCHECHRCVTNDILKERTKLWETQNQINIPKL